MEPPLELRLHKLSKRYPDGVEALRDVSLSIGPGMFGLLGPNGAGKSTLMRIIATLQEPDEGAVFLGEIDVLRQKQEVRKVLGYLPQEFGLYPMLNAETLLAHFAVLKGIEARRERKSRVEALLRQTNLWDDRKRRFGGYSGGMKQRFGIAVALLASPKLIIVDEPTAGLDPSERMRFLNLLAEVGENSIVLLSTHIVDDVNGLCDNMAIIERGEILLETEPRAARAELEGRLWCKLLDKNELDMYQATYDVLSTRLLAGRILIRVHADTRPDDSFEPVEPELEDVYFAKLRVRRAAAAPKA